MFASVASFDDIVVMLLIEASLQGMLALSELIQP
jgi:hypothetical protein